jgi:hypothetical protein
MWQFDFSLTFLFKNCQINQILNRAILASFYRNENTMAFDAINVND